MDLRHKNNEMDKDFLQNENTKSEKYIGHPIYNVKTCKSNSNKIKCGLSELSNDKFYLETELPARKRFKPESGLLNSTNKVKICKTVRNDDKILNFVNKEKYSGGIHNILSGEKRFENPPETEFIKCDLNEDMINKLNKSSLWKSGSSKSVLPNTLSNQCELNLNELSKVNFEKQPYNDFEFNLKNYFCKNLDENKISNEDESETEFDDEINKCCKLLNVDVPNKAIVETTDAETTTNAQNNFGNKLIENSEFHKSEISNPNDKNQSLNALNPQLNKLAVSFNENINSTINTSKKLKIQGKFLNKKDTSFEDNMNFKYKDNSVSSTTGTSKSFLTTCDKISNINESSHNEINIHVKDKNPFECKYSDIKNITLEPNISNGSSSTSIRESNTNTNIFKIHDSKSSIEHLGLTTEDTLMSDILEFQEIHQGIICQDYLKDEIVEVSSINNESSDTLILCEESDIDTDETKEINKASASGSELPILIQKNKKNATSFFGSLDEISNASREVEKKNNFVLREKIDLSNENHLPNNKNCELPVLDVISHDDYIHSKLNESFVSEYEISLLIDDTASILSEESFDSEYEVSLLEDDLNDQEHQNESCDSEYKVSLLEDEISKEGDQNDTNKNRSDFNISLKCLPNVDEGGEKIASSPQIQTSGSKTDLKSDQATIINNINLCKKEVDEVVIEKLILFASNNDLDVKQKMQTISKTNEQTTNIDNVNLCEKVDNELLKIEKIIVAGNNDLDVKKEMQTISKTDDQTTNIGGVNLCEKDEVVIEKIIVASNNDLKVRKEMQTVSKTDGEKEDEVIIEKIIIVASNNDLDLKKKTQTISKIDDKTTNLDNVDLCEKGKIILNLEQSAVEGSEESVIDGILIKREPPENSKDSQYSLKFKINNESEKQNKLKFKSSELKSQEEKSININTDISAGSSCIDNAIVCKIERTELDVSNANNKLQLSNKVTTDEAEKFNKKVLIVDRNKQLTENISTDKANGEKIKIDLVTTASNDSKQGIENIIPDYYEDEKDDLINPGWNKIKELSTDEERYRQVRDCWESKSIPNPFKNLTYYSYRKKINFGENNTRITRQHKRHASNNLLDNNAKRTRTCTYIFDDRIKSIEKEKEMKAQKIQNKMYDEVDRLNKQCLQEEKRLQSFNGYHFNPRMQQFELNGLRREFQEKISFVTAEYEQRVYNCRDQFTSEINSLKNNRNEILQFYSFYKGLSINENKDPTVLTNAQMQELEEIENIYNQMDYHYR